jgi:hypothetical protein
MDRARKRNIWIAWGILGAGIVVSFVLFAM